MSTGPAPRDERRPQNRLANATSPYLLQHAGNPVDWYEWGPEALDRARREEKPILLSIGYAACHWCHVMAHESFEDPEVARIMNEHFVCVKVDREERPDLDSIYMDAVQAMTGSGGWPMTVFLTPDGEPFYAGTYFPPEDRHGLPGFPRLLLTLAQTWRERRDDVLSQSARVVLHLSQAASPSGSPEPLTEELLRGAHASMTASFDREWGGFGGAPKFPQPMTLGFLLGCHLRGYAGALDMVTTTLDRMADGGIHDHVGGGGVGGAGRPGHRGAARRGGGGAGAAVPGAVVARSSRHRRQGPGVVERPGDPGVRRSRPCAGRTAVRPSRRGRGRVRALGDAARG